MEKLMIMANLRVGISLVFILGSCSMLFAQIKDEAKINAIIKQIQAMKIETLNNQFQSKVFYGLETKSASGEIEGTEFVGFTTSSNYMIIEKESLLDGAPKHEEFYFDVKGDLIAYVLKNTPTLNTVFLTENEKILAIYRNKIVDTPFGMMQSTDITSPLKKQCMNAGTDARKTYNKLSQIKK